MKIGADYDKIEVHAFDLALLEPNAFIGDAILGILSLIIGFYLFKRRAEHKFYSYWIAFFFTMGLGFIMGGLGHLFWNYWGVEGKYFSWYSGILGTLFAEQAMISLNKNGRERSVFYTLVRLKFVYAVLVLSFLIMTRDLTQQLGVGLSVSLISTGIGTLFAFVYLPFHYRQQLRVKLHHFWISVLILLPVIYVQAGKFNLAPWFDRNDISHILMFIALILYVLGINQFHRKAQLSINKP